MKHLDNYIDQILLYAMCITICITMYIYSVTMETGLVCILNTGAWLYNRFYVSVVKQPLALLWHCVWYSNLSRGNGMYFLWTVTNDYHPSDKNVLMTTSTSQQNGPHMVIYSYTLRVLRQNVTNRKWCNFKYWTGISICTPESLPHPMLQLQWRFD